MDQGTVTIRWRESRRWHEVAIAPDWRPQTTEERQRHAARLLIWKGAPLVEAYMQSKAVH